MIKGQALGFTVGFYEGQAFMRDRLRDLWCFLGFRLKTAGPKVGGSSLLSVGSGGSQDGEATWRFLVPTRIDTRRRQQLLRWS